jgi:hypothetical protein
MVLRETFEPKRVEVTGGWIELYNEKIDNLYTSPNIMTINLKMIRCTGHVAYMEEMRNIYEILDVR